MFVDDLKLNADGSSVLEDGDFTVTTDNAQFVINMLLTSKGSWKLNPELGIGLETFFAEMTQSQIIKRAPNIISTFLRKYAIFPTLMIVPSGIDAVFISLDIDSAALVKPKRLAFSFNIENGIVKFIDLDTKMADTVSTKVTKNKYFSRR